MVLANEHVSFVILSDVWLDHPQTFGALEKLFQGYAEAAEFRPMVFVFCGNFAEKGWEAAGGIPRYTGKLFALLRRTDTPQPASTLWRISLFASQLFRSLPTLSSFLVLQIHGLHRLCPAIPFHPTSLNACVNEYRRLAS